VLSDYTPMAPTQVRAPFTAMDGSQRRRSTVGACSRTRTVRACAWSAGTGATTLGASATLVVVSKLPAALARAGRRSGDLRPETPVAVRV